MDKIIVVVTIKSDANLHLKSNLLSAMDVIVMVAILD